MTDEKILLIAIGILQTIGTSAFFWGRWTQGREAKDETLAERLDREAASWNDWRQKKGQDISDLATEVRDRETQLRREFVDHDRCKERMTLMRGDGK